MRIPCTFMSSELAKSFLGLPAPCSVRYYQPMAFILLHGTELTKKVRDCTLLPTIQIHTQTSPPGLCILLPQRIPTSNANIHEFQKRGYVRAAARHLAQSFQVLFHSCISASKFLPRILYNGFSIVSCSREPQQTHVFLT